ncbi:MAG: cobalamin biosynthesis protein CobD [Lachnospiraceae bacterium]|nr:cobalamin biosynthesis protein CobD [Lachnospiraceae bacterium]
MTFQILATKSLRVESMRVYKCLKQEDLEAARQAVSMIVGRDTATLDEVGVAKAAIETVAENTSDGVIAPMLYTALGGPVLGFLYKAVNTMDSMIGYKNDKYLYFGRAAAKLDDIVNFIPARISAYLMIFSAFMSGKCFDGRNAFKIYKRDNRKHASPNSAQTEAVCAGALRIQLAGDASYFGKIVKKPYIGDAYRKVESEDIKRANRLMYLTAWLGELLCLLLMTASILR